MKAIKSIFDKSYIVEAQAIKAGEKEWPQGHANIASLSFDDATRKYRWVPVGGILTCEQEYGKSDLQLADEAVEKRDVTLAEALAESGETLADIIEDEHVPGFSRCPSCDIHLSNGVGEHMQIVNKEPVKHEAFQYECLGCGHEFGPAINLGDAMANATMMPAGPRPRLSSCEKPTKKVWHIADSMPKASRKDVMAECVRQGIAYGTARTQYQAWFKASQEGGDGSVRRPYAKAEA